VLVEAVVPPPKAAPIALRENGGRQPCKRREERNAMSDFESALKAKLDRNAELAQQREEAEREMDRAKAAREEADQRHAVGQADARKTRHAELATHLERLAGQLKEASGEQFVLRTAWTQSSEEFITKISTRGLNPARSLFIELDRDDDEVLVRWTSDVGNSLELWRLLEVNPDHLTQLLLQVADQDLWRNAASPPPFPGARE
jgi:hypothetical protein